MFILYPYYSHDFTLLKKLSLNNLCMYVLWGQWVTELNWTELLPSFLSQSAPVFLGSFVHDPSGFSLFSSFWFSRAASTLCQTLAPFFEAQHIETLMNSSLPRQLSAAVFFILLPNQRKHLFILQLQIDIPMNVCIIQMKC